MKDNSKLETPKINLHTHSRFSDGASSIMMIVDRALELDFNYIAITDHFSNSWKARIIKTLDSYKKINIYLKSIATQKERVSSKKIEFKLLKGIEIDLGSTFDYIQKLINPNHFDLILLEYMNSIETIEFTEDLLDVWIKESERKQEDLPIFGLAHCDPSHFVYENLDIFLDFLEQYNIYFEFNSAYSNYYSARYMEFFEGIKSRNIPVGIGADAHNLDELDLINDPLNKIGYYGLMENYLKLIYVLRNIK